MNCSILNLTLFQQGHVYAPEDLGRQDILVSGSKIVAIAPSISPEDFPGCECINLDGAIVCPWIYRSTRPSDWRRRGSRAAYPHAGSALVTPG